jgi:hypothetical protein
LIIKPTLDEDVGTYTVKLSGVNEEINSARLIPAGESDSAAQYESTHATLLSISTISKSTEEES